MKDVVTLNEDAEKTESDPDSKTEESDIEDDDVKDDPADSGDADGDLSGEHDGKCYLVNPKRTQGLNVRYMYTISMSLTKSQNQISYIYGFEL